MCLGQRLRKLSYCFLASFVVVRRFVSMDNVQLIRDLAHVDPRLLIAHPARKMTTYVHFTNYGPSLVVLDHLKVVILGSVHKKLVIPA